MMLEQRVLKYIREHRLLAGQPKLLVAVSGGPDSVCLLHVLVEMSAELGIELHVAHLNHQLRGAEADDDARYVAGLADEWGLPATVERRDVNACRAQLRTSLEEAAREVRYNFLAEVARSIGAGRVAVGHTADDQVETVLMHLIRGTGIRGLRGLQPESRWLSPGYDLTIVRPLLEVRRQETVEYCNYYRLEPRIDTSNLSLSPLRNRIRHQLVPLLQSYNPRITQALLRMAGIAADDLAFLDEATGRSWQEVAHRENDTVVFDKEKLSGLPVSVKRNLLRMAIERLVGNVKDIEAQHIERLVTALEKPAGKRIVLPGGLSFSIEYDRYLLGRDAVALSPLPVLADEYPLQLPGETLLPGWQVKAAVISRDEMAAGGDNFTAYLDLDKTGDRVIVRSRQRGDRFQPLGMGQPKRLAEFMVDVKIPRSWRDSVPLVCSPGQILWLVGWRIDDRVKVTGTTRRILRLEFKRR